MEKGITGVKKSSNSLLVVIIILFLLATLFQNIFLFIKTSQMTEKITARVQEGIVSLCINMPPILNNTCNTTIYEHTNYSCKVNATNSDNDTLTFSSKFLTNRTIFNITSSGWITFSANQSHVGNHSVNISVDDNVNCSNSKQSGIFNFTVINVNDPPVLISNIPNQSFVQGNILFAFLLNDYFMDPDGDHMIFSASTPSFVNIQITEVGQVIITASSCGQDSVRFFASDGSYTTPSNWVGISVSCTTTPPSSGPTGGGGGGGGGQEECIPDWKCFRWGACMPNGTRTRECYDLNVCTNNYKKVEIENCTYLNESVCIESWDCLTWTRCLPNGTQTRICKDLNNCGPELKKPNITQSCTYIPTCFDGIQNQNEEGIDCGGICKPCQEPTPIIPTPAKTPTTILIILILLLTILLLIYKYFRKQIYQTLARVGWMFTKKQEKQFLIKNEIKELLLKKLFEIEKRIKTERVNVLAIEVTNLVREYFKNAFELTTEYTYEELINKINKKRIDKTLKKILISFASRATTIEFGKHILTKAELYNLIDEFREIISQTSFFKDEDRLLQLKERFVVALSKADDIYITSSNANIAIQFLQLTAAKKIYINMIGKYEKLSPKEKDFVYKDIIRLYNEIKYLQSSSYDKVM